LQQQHEYPSISILLPIYPNSPDDRQQTPIRVKNLMREAEDRLKKEFTQRDIAPVLERLTNLGTDIDYDHGTQGMAIFVNANFARIFYLPFSVEERVAINHGFATRDLVIAKHRSTRYFVLSLTQKVAHLYEGMRDHLREIEDFGFPMPIEIKGVENELPNTYHVEVTTLHDKYEREFFQRVEAAIESAMNQEHIPLALVGVERTLAYFDEVAFEKTKPKFSVVARLHGAYEKLPLREMETKIWPLVEEGLKGGNSRVIERLGDASGNGRKATGLREVWKAAQEARIDTLLVEENYHQAARAQESGLHLVDATEREAPDVLDDAVDETIEQVLNTGGDIVFFAPGELQDHEHIAAILRY
jgi:hypothetical protein